MVKGVIFDFNGTLFWDSQLHIDAWKIFSKKLRGTPFSDDEMLKYMFGRTNSYIVEYALQRKPSKELVEQYATEKEQYYRDVCKNSPDIFKLAPGAVEFLEFLKENNIPRAIATMSEWANVEFYIKEFGLENWFDLDNIIYSDGKIQGKPSPEIYNIAMKKLDLEPNKCLVIEDAISGLIAAKDANAGKIIAIASREPKEFYKDLTYIDSIITDFNQIDRKMFVEN